MRKFLSLPVERQHNKCALALSKNDLITYALWQNWMQLEPLENTPEAISNRYHFHMSQAGKSLKEHNLLVEQGDREFAEEPWQVNIYLDHIRSAHNVGSIVRTCEALSLGTLYFSPQTPFIDHPQVQKRAMGCSAFVKAISCEQIDRLPKPLIALETTRNATSLYDFIFPEIFTLAVGNEEYGLSTEILDKADAFVRIPLRGRKNSLNVANAFAIAASEIQRQKILYNY